MDPEELRFECKHNLGFKFNHHWVPIPGWFCIRCDLHLNFNPERFPEGPAYVLKRYTEAELLKWVKDAFGTL